MAEGARLESVYTFTRIEGSNPSLTARFYSCNVLQDLKRLKSKGFKPFLLSHTIHFIYCNPDILGGITGGIINYPQNYPPILRKNSNDHTPKTL